MTDYDDDKGYQKVKPRKKPKVKEILSVNEMKDEEWTEIFAVMDSGAVGLYQL